METRIFMTLLVFVYIYMIYNIPIHKVSNYTYGDYKLRYS